jgi:hypothetical protein
MAKSPAASSVALVNGRVQRNQIAARDPDSPFVSLKLQWLVPESSGRTWH